MIFIKMFAPISVYFMMMENGTFPCMKLPFPLCLQPPEISIILLQFCEPSNPKQLFNTHLLAMNNVFKQKYPFASDEQITAGVLQDLQSMLNYAGISLESFSLPTFQSNLLQEMLTQHNMPYNNSVVSNITQKELAFYLEQTHIVFVQGICKC